MAVRSSNIGSTKGFNWGGKSVSALSWAIAVYMTEKFISVLAPGQQNLIIAALLVQAIMTAAESPIWRNEGRWYNWTVLGIDTITNVGGLFVYITRLDQTDSWEAFNTGLGITGGLHPFAALVVSVVLGILLAATPEFLWRQK